MYLFSSDIFLYVAVVAAKALGTEQCVYALIDTPPRRHCEFEPQGANK